MSLSTGDYRPRDAEHAMLYRVIDEHLDAFLETARRHADGAALPAFVEQEFRDFLTCGVLAHGFARLRCAVLVQRPGLLSQLWRPAHDRVRRAPGRRGASAGARAPVGAERAVPAALFAGVGSRTRARGARRVRARVARLP